MQDPSPNRINFNRRQIAGNIAALFSSSVVAQAMSVLALMLTARILGPEKYGQYTASFLLAYFASIVVNLGLDTWLLRQGGQQPVRMREWFGSVLAARCVLGVIWFLAILIFSSLFTSTVFPAQLVQFAALFVLLEILLFTIITTFKAALRNILSSILEVLVDFVWLIGTIFLVITGVKQVLDYAQIRLFSALVIFPVGLVIIWRIYKPQPTLTIALKSLQESPPFAISQFLSMLLMRVDVLIISFALGSYSAGIYAPAVGLVGALFLFPNAIFMVFTPVLSNLFSIDTRQAWKTSLRNLGLQAILGATVSLCVWFGADLIVLLLGDQYLPTAGILKILSPIVFLQSIAFGLVAIIIAVNLQSMRAFVQAGATILNILLNVAVVGWAGINGVAIVYIITEFILVSSYIIIVLNFYFRNKKVILQPKSSLSSDHPS